MVSLVFSSVGFQLRSFQTLVALVDFSEMSFCSACLKIPYFFLVDGYENSKC